MNRATAVEIGVHSYATFVVFYSCTRRALFTELPFRIVYMRTAFPRGAPDFVAVACSQIFRNSHPIIPLAIPAAVPVIIEHQQKSPSESSIKHQTNLTVVLLVLIKNTRYQVSVIERSIDTAAVYK